MPSRDDEIVLTFMPRRHYDTMREALAQVETAIHTNSSQYWRDWRERVAMLTQFLDAVDAAAATRPDLGMEEIAGYFTASVGWCIAKSENAVSSPHGNEPTGEPVRDGADDNRPSPSVDASNGVSPADPTPTHRRGNPDGE